jgi:hypothetical protein
MLALVSCLRALVTTAQEASKCQTLGRPRYLRAGILKSSNSINSKHKDAASAQLLSGNRENLTKTASLYSIRTGEKIASGLCPIIHRCAAIPALC